MNNFFTLIAAIFIEDSELLAVKDKTNRYLRLRENLLKNSMNSDMIVSKCLIFALKMF